ncbi:hypothetical protein [Vulcanisaeta souniana]|uniref:hypothetical protein n=1 Tax=Vulcanisaeta souniana TaxID=164452 RepID=UPI000ADE92B4|nr:hypothetical protein [Vulcanisaeta souniana]
MTNEVGFIVNVENPLIYIASIKRNSGVNRYDYVYMPMRDYVNDREVNVNVLGQVLWVRREPYRIGADGYVPTYSRTCPGTALLRLCRPGSWYSAISTVIGYTCQGQRRPWAPPRFT